MGSTDKMPRDDFAVRLGQDEIALIFNLKEDLDYTEQVASHAARYQELGWQPRAVSASDASDLEVDFSQPEEAIYDQINAIQQAGLKINLTLPTPGPARLLVVEIRNEKGIASLDRWGNWRSSCWAFSEERGEQHYYLLPAGFSVPRTSFLSKSGIMVYGQEGLVLAPPSTAPPSQASWEWVAPPWESTPILPGPAIWQFLKERKALSGETDPHAVSELPSWEEIYNRIAPFGELIRALVAPAVSFEQYYERLLDTARGFLIADPTLLLGLLWHAPRGDIRECPQRWLYLQNLAATASSRGLGMPAPERPARARGFHDALTSLQEYQELPPAPPGRSPAPDQAYEEAAGRDLPSAEPSSEPFSFLEKRIVLEPSQYQAMLSEMAELSKKAVDLERRLAEQETRLQTTSSSVPPAELPPAGKGRPDQAARPASESAIKIEQPHERGARGVQAAFREFLEENPDLDEPDRVRMLQFYLKNYIEINPENYGLPFLEKLAMAAKMVRDFLGE